MDMTYSNTQIQQSVGAQARLRLRLGLVTMFAMLAAFHIWGPAFPGVGWLDASLLSILYLSYTIAAWKLSHPNENISAHDLVIVTAVMDPLMLTGWLLILGVPSILFASFYLFTILGFGFRVGVAPMQICHAFSLVGLTIVGLYSPAWQLHSIVGLAHGFLLLVVPLYASTLIKQLHEARREAEQESNAKSQLLANVSHELRTPLNGIVSTAQLILSESTDQAATQRAASILELSANLDAEIGQLLDVAKAHSKGMLENRTVFELRDSISQVQLALSEVARIKNIKLSMHVDEKINRKLLGNFHALTSTLMNLTGNAVKFTDIGHVQLNAKVVEELSDTYTIEFRITDSGIGIPEKDQARIFEPFFRVENGAMRRHGGTGLGTTIASDNVKRMGGELKLKSSLGIGSEFWFTLKLQKAEHEQNHAVEILCAPLSSKKRILIADDHLTNLNLLKEMFEKDGHEVIAVSSGKAALEFLATDDCDALFLDYNMAELDGLKTFEIYRFSKTNVAPTFFVTADSSAATVTKLRESGANGIIFKPVTFQKLREALSTADQFQTFGNEEPMPTDKPQKPSASFSADAQNNLALKAVPVEYINTNALDVLREINPSSLFIKRMLTEGLSDIEKLIGEMEQSWQSKNISDIRDHAHSIKGVSLNIGAVRLAAIANSCMSLTLSQLERDQQSLQGIRETAQQSARAIKEIIHSLESKS